MYTVYTVFIYLNIQLKKLQYFRKTINFKRLYISKFLIFNTNSKTKFEKLNTIYFSYLITLVVDVRLSGTVVAQQYFNISYLFQT